MSRLTGLSRALALCAALLPCHLLHAQVHAQEEEEEKEEEEPEIQYPAMDPPTDYTEQQHQQQRERDACIITAACDQPARGRNTATVSYGASRTPTAPIAPAHPTTSRHSRTRSRLR